MEIEKQMVLRERETRVEKINGNKKREVEKKTQTEFTTV